MWPDSAIHPRRPTKNRPPRDCPDRQPDRTAGQDSRTYLPKKNMHEPAGQNVGKDSRTGQSDVPTGQTTGKDHGQVNWTGQSDVPARQTVGKDSRTDSRTKKPGRYQRTEGVCRGYSPFSAVSLRRSVSICCSACAARLAACFSASLTSASPPFSAAAFANNRQSLVYGLHLA